MYIYIPQFGCVFGGKGTFFGEKGLIKDGWKESTVLVDTYLPL